MNRSVRRQCLILLFLLLAQFVSPPANALSKPKEKCSAAQEGKYSKDKKWMCVWADRGRTKSVSGLFAWWQVGTSPATVNAFDEICNGDGLYWEGKNWYDSIWRCDYHQIGSLNGLGWYKLKNASDPQTANSNMPICSTQSSIARISYGRDRDNIANMMFQNLGNCSIALSVQASIQCKAYQNPVQIFPAVGFVNLKPRGSLTLLWSQISQIFPQAKTLCDALQKGAPAEYGVGILTFVPSNVVKVTILSAS